MSTLQKCPTRKAPASGAFRRLRSREKGFTLRRHKPSFYRRRELVPRTPQASVFSTQNRKFQKANPQPTPNGSSGTAKRPGCEKKHIPAFFLCQSKRTFTTAADGQVRRCPKLRSCRPTAEQLRSLKTGKKPAAEERARAAKALIERKRCAVKRRKRMLRSRKKPHPQKLLRRVRESDSHNIIGEKRPHLRRHAGVLADAAVALRTVGIVCLRV